MTNFLSKMVSTITFFFKKKDPKDSKSKVISEAVVVAETVSEPTPAPAPPITIDAETHQPVECVKVKSTMLNTSVTAEDFFF